MIVPMKKLTLLLYYKEKESFLSSLQELGVVHIEENSEASSEEKLQLLHELQEAEKVLKGFEQLAASATEKKAAAAKGKEAPEIISEYNALMEKKDALEQEAQHLSKEIALLEPWGNFDPAVITALEDAGVKLHFYEVSEKEFKALELEHVAARIISRQAGRVYFVVVDYKTESSIDADEVVLPRNSLKETRHNYTSLQKEEAAVTASLSELCAYNDRVQEYYVARKEHFSLESARLSMNEAAEGKIVSMTGWFPVKKEKQLRTFLEQYAGWFSIDEPTQDDDIPVLMQNRRFSRLFEPITKILSLPDYFELDPTPFFAPFFTFFFGLCLGDLGYGFLIFLLSLFLYFKASKKMKGVVVMGMILGCMTMFTGILLNSFFGHAIFKVASGDQAFFSKAGYLASLADGYAKQKFPAMTFALYVGVIQIIFGVILQCINKFRNNGFAYILHPVSNILLISAMVIYLAHQNFMQMGDYILGAIHIGALIRSVPLTTALWIAIVGLSGMFLFNNPDKKLAARFGLGFWELYNFLSGFVGDALSYIRLFALGLAGGLLGKAFNDIAFMLVTRDNTVDYTSPLIIFTVLILIVGHALNFGLSALGAFVHSLRLTFVEFYNNLQYKGGSKAYTPLSKVHE